jgi:zinc D-Ala-D-Ala carboxypeptidase
VSDWEHFTRDEMKCKGTDECRMDEKFMERLERLRSDYGRPMVVSSGYRDISYNTTIGGSPNSAHTQGKAVDILVAGHDAFRVLRLAIIHGFTGIGVSQRGMYERRFLHLDTAADTDKSPRPWIWSYK